MGNIADFSIITTWIRESMMAQSTSSCFHSSSKNTRLTDG